MLLAQRSKKGTFVPIHCSRILRHLVSRNMVHQVWELQLGLRLLAALSFRSVAAFMTFAGTKCLKNSLSSLCAYNMLLAPSSQKAAPSFIYVAAVWKQHALDLLLGQQLLGADYFVRPPWTVMPFEPPICKNQLEITPQKNLSVLRPAELKKTTFWKVWYVSFGGCVSFLLAVGNHYVSSFKTHGPITTKIW